MRRCCLLEKESAVCDCLKLIGGAKDWMKWVNKPKNGGEFQCKFQFGFN